MVSKIRPIARSLALVTSTIRVSRNISWQNWPARHRPANCLAAPAAIVAAPTATTAPVTRGGARPTVCAAACCTPDATLAAAPPTALAAARTPCFTPAATPRPARPRPRPAEANWRARAGEVPPAGSRRSSRRSSVCVWGEGVQYSRYGKIRRACGQISWYATLLRCTGLGSVCGSYWFVTHASLYEVEFKDAFSLRGVS